MTASTTPRAATDDPSTRRFMGRTGAGIAPTLLRLPDLDVPPSEPIDPITQQLPTSSEGSRLDGVVAESSLETTASPLPSSSSETIDVAAEESEPIEPSSDSGEPDKELVSLIDDPVASATSTVVTAQATWLDLAASRTTLVVLLAIIAGYAIFGPRGADPDLPLDADVWDSPAELATLESIPPDDTDDPGATAGLLAVSTDVSALEAAVPVVEAPAPVVEMVEADAMSSMNGADNDATTEIAATDAIGQLREGAESMIETAVGQPPSRDQTLSGSPTEASLAAANVSSNNTIVYQPADAVTNGQPPSIPGFESADAKHEPTLSRTPNRITDWMQFLPPLAGPVATPPDMGGATMAPPAMAAPPYVQTASPSAPNFDALIPGRANRTGVGAAVPATAPDARVANPNPNSAIR
ncbi:MAG: hypothetical protein AAGJ40_13865 [Planctomycetota bacterium]